MLSLREEPLKGLDKTLGNKDAGIRHPSQITSR